VKKIVTIIVLFLLCNAITAQSISRQVISSTGSIDSPGISSSTTGPSNLYTVENENIVLTQGFQQPLSTTTLGVEIITVLPDCNNYNGGAIDLLISGCSGIYAITWGDGSSEPSLNDLIPGTYEVTISTANGCSFNESIELPLDENCSGALPNVITVNSDDTNDFWIIPQAFSETNSTNTVSIFNRWGQEVWTAVNYDNTSVFWTGENKSGELLPTGTYFYKIELPNETLTGFIELLR